MGLFFNGTELGKFTDTLSGGLNLLNNTLTMTGFNNMNNHSDDGIGFSIEPKEGYLSSENANEIKTNVFHVFAHKFLNAPFNFGQDIYLPAGTWTLSFLAKNFSDSGAVNTVNFYSDWCENQNWAPLGTSDLIDGVWRKHKITFKTNQAILHKNLRLHNATQDDIPGGSLCFANVKLEAGSQATMYCPNYQDIIAELKTSIGGRNYLLNSADFSKNWTIIPGSAVSDQTYLNGKIINLANDGDAVHGAQTLISNISDDISNITWSCFAKADNNGDILHTELWGGKPSYNQPLTTEWHRYIFSGNLDEKNHNIFFWGNKENKGNIQIALPKAEIGSSATDWTPAPEDFLTK